MQRRSRELRKELGGARRGVRGAVGPATWSPARASARPAARCASARPSTCASSTKRPWPSRRRWIPILRCRRLVWRGPPAAAADGEERGGGGGRPGADALERLLTPGKKTKAAPCVLVVPRRRRGVGRISRMLSVQYRMHERISDWAPTFCTGASCGLPRRCGDIR